MVTYKIEDFSGKQINRHRSNFVPYYPKKIFVQEQMEKYFSDNSLLRLHPKKPTITKSKSVSFSLAISDIPSTNDLPPTHCSLSEIPKSTSENFTTRDTLLDANRRKTIEFLYHTRKLWLLEQRMYKHK